eukprot:scaffold45727_cov28-Tisochrysis_lutea.AAC.1
MLAKDCVYMCVLTCAGASHGAPNGANPDLGPGGPAAGGLAPSQQQHEQHPLHPRDPPRLLPDASMLAEMPLDMMLQQLQVCICLLRPILPTSFLLLPCALCMSMKDIFVVHVLSTSLVPIPNKLSMCALCVLCVCACAHAYQRTYYWNWEVFGMVAPCLLIVLVSMYVDITGYAGSARTNNTG